MPGMHLGDLTITSPAFRHGQPIPAEHTAEGDDVSPALEWANVPEGTRELSGPLVCAGFTDPWSAFGLDPASRQDERTTAATRTADALDPYLDARLQRDLLRGGITSYRAQAGATAKVGGLGCLVRVRPGADLDESTLLEDACVAMSVGVTRSGGGVDVFDRLAEEAHPDWLEPMPLPPALAGWRLYRVLP